MFFEVGVNTRHIEATERSQVAFRTGGETGGTDAESVGTGGGPGGDTAMSTSLRFTGRTAYNTFVGVEGEAGAILGRSGSNLAGAYGVAGARGDLANVRIAVEAVAGRRWVRYDLGGGAKSDPSMWIVEPRVRADLWLGRQVTLGAAVGATLSERSVWMAGVYLGFNSAAFNEWR